MNDDTLAQWHAEQMDALRVIIKQMDALREITRLLKILTCEHSWVVDYCSPYDVGKTAQVPRVSCSICGKVKSPGVA